MSKLLFAGVLCGLAEHFALLKLPESLLGIILSAVIGGCILAAAIFAIKYLSGDEKLWFKNSLKRVVAARAKKTGKTKIFLPMKCTNK